jgi:hypothetical protein
MAFSLKLSEIADAIAALSVSGVTVKDRNELTASWAGTPNVLYPNIDGPWVTDLSLDYRAMIRGTNAPVNVSYTLNYRFLGVQVGDLAILPTAYSNLIDKVIAIINALVAMDSPYSGAMNIEIAAVSDLHPLADPAGNMYYGCDFALRVEEIQN